MGKFRFVRPVLDRIELTDGDWIEVKHRLNVGERRGVLSRAAKGGVSTDGQRVHLDGAEMAFARVEAWVTDWSFVGSDGKPMKLSASAIRALDPDSFAEIEAAIDAHEEAQERTKNSPASTDSSLSSTPSHIAIASTESSPSAIDSTGPTPT